MSEFIVAIDAGTQSIRAALVDYEGTIHKIVKTPIEPYFCEEPGWAEQRLSQRQFLGVVVRFVAMYLVLTYFLLS